MGYLDSRFALDELDDKMVLFLLFWITFVIIRMSLQVSTSFQNRGLGSLLLNAAEAIASYCHLDACRLTVFKQNQRAHQLYLRHSYIQGYDPLEHPSCLLMSRYVNLIVCFIYNVRAYLNVWSSVLVAI